MAFSLTSPLESRLASASPFDIVDWVDYDEVDLSHLLRPEMLTPQSCSAPVTEDDVETTFPLLFRGNGSSNGIVRVPLEYLYSPGDEKKEPVVNPFCWVTPEVETIGGIRHYLKRTSRTRPALVIRVPSSDVGSKYIDFLERLRDKIQEWAPHGFVVRPLLDRRSDGAPVGAGAAAAAAAVAMPTPGRTSQWLPLLSRADDSLKTAVVDLTPTRILGEKRLVADLCRGVTQSLKMHGVVYGHWLVVDTQEKTIRLDMPLGHIWLTDLLITKEAEDDAMLGVGLGTCSGSKLLRSAFERPRAPVPPPLPATPLASTVKNGSSTLEAPGAPPRKIARGTPAADKPTFYFRRNRPAAAIAPLSLTSTPPPPAASAEAPPPPPETKS